MTEPDLEALSSRLSAAANAQRGSDPSIELKSTLNALAGLPRETHPAVSAMVTDLLPKLNSPTGAGFICAWLGAGVEAGVPAERSCAAIVETFLRWSRTIQDEAGDDEANQETLAGLRHMASSVVSHLSHLAEDRKSDLEIKQLQEETERILHVSDGAMWVNHLLRQQSGELIALIADQRRGYHLRYENIASSFHLFTLLQDALAAEKPKGAELERMAVAVAKGQSHAACSDRAWWHYGQPSSTEPDMAASVWGEGPPGDIGRVDGRQVMILWPPVLGSRSWDAGFLTPFLQAAPPKVDVVTQLGPEETREWWTKVGIAEPKPWWKIW